MSRLKKSPTINEIKDTMKEIREKIDNSNENMSIYTICFLILYPIICLFYLITFKPSVCCNKTELQNNEKKLSYSKVVLVYILMLLPLFFYLILRFL